MSSERATEILYESEALLRLVDNELTRMRGGDEPDTLTIPESTEYPQLVESANEQLLAVIEQIRSTRASLRRNDVVRRVQNENDQTLAEIEARLLDITRLFEASMIADAARSDSSDTV
jgi:hypothetical protein